MIIDHKCLWTHFCLTFLGCSLGLWLEIELAVVIGTSPITVCQSRKFLAPASVICQMSPTVISVSLSFLWVCHSTFGTRAFFVARPTVWNSLPDHLRDPAIDSNNLSRTCRRIRSLNIRSVNALEVLTHRHLLSYNCACYYKNVSFLASLTWC